MTARLGGSISVSGIAIFDRISMSKMFESYTTTLTRYEEKHLASNSQRLGTIDIN